MQRISDLEAEAAALTAENQSLKAAQRNRHPQPNPQELADAIGARLTRVEQNLREDFVGKFAGILLPPLETFNKRVADAEERQTNIERKLVTHKAEIAKMLEEANQKQLTTLQRFNNAVKLHHEKNEATLAAQQQSVEACNYAADVTAQAAEACINFNKDYEDMARLGKLALTDAKNQIQHEISEFTQELVAQSKAAVEPALQRLRRLSDSQIEWRMKWSVLGFALCLVITVAVSWGLSPSSFTMRDAARWRNWQAGNFTQEQADRVNKTLQEIEQENARKAGKEQKDK